jgi:hypothetical protein
MRGKHARNVDARPEPTGVRMHRDWTRLCIAWRAFLTGACERARAPSASGLRPEAWVALHLGDGTYIVEWVDGEELARAHRVPAGSMPEPNGIGPIEVDHPPSLRFEGNSIERSPRLPLPGCFSVRYGLLAARAGFLTVCSIEGSGKFEEDAILVS